MLIWESERRVKRKPLVNKYRPTACIANTQTRTSELFINAAGKNGGDRKLCVCRLHDRMTTTYHIQDLRLLLPPLDFELRVNKHYPEVNLSFREWLQELPRGDLVQAEDLSTHGFDLLCSLCFPTIDPPQLLRVSKLCALTFLANDGLVRAEVSPSRWLNRYVSCLEPTFGNGDSVPYLSFPNPERLLRAAHSIRTTQTRELQRSPHVTSGTNVLQLASNLLSLFYPLREANTRNSHPGLPEFLVILENTHDHKFSEELTNDTLLETLWRCTTNIIMRSQVI